MSRSRKKPVAKLKNDRFFKKYYNRKIRRGKIILHPRGYFKKLNCCWDICDFNTGELSQQYIDKWYSKDEQYRLTMK